MDLSTDVWRMVLSFLTPGDLVKVAQTCSRMRDCCKSLPLWSELRQELRLPERRPKAWKLKSDYSLVVASSCFKCRFQKKMPDLPLCRFCVGSHFPLGRLRLKAQRMAVDLDTTEYYRRMALRRDELDIEKYNCRIRFLKDSIKSTQSLFDAVLEKHKVAVRDSR